MTSAPQAAHTAVRPVRYRSPDLARAIRLRVPIDLDDAHPSVRDAAFLFVEVSEHCVLVSNLPPERSMLLHNDSDISPTGDLDDLCGAEGHREAGMDAAGEHRGERIEGGFS